ncbi:hypothetical protein BDV98DRAFT_596305 [Pterulicium gracile]|uniref:Uncharacterized protein n=1 Tax=Pterulicium gracile TaxID=1884261 RepID=A0A5C3Q9Q4_9AGAR|nr:hypothetical protein BDV98DRAFT_596305 [Pterula gracilis]
MIVRDNLSKFNRWNLEYPSYGPWADISRALSNWPTLLSVPQFCVDRLRPTRNRQTDVIPDLSFLAEETAGKHTLVLPDFGIIHIILQSGLSAKITRRMWHKRKYTATLWRSANIKRIRVRSLIENKRSPGNGLIGNVLGQEINSGLFAAQSSLIHQTSYVFHSQFGMGQERVILIAACGEWFMWTIMLSSDPRMGPDVRDFALDLDQDDKLPPVIDPDQQENQDMLVNEEEEGGDVDDAEDNDEDGDERDPSIPEHLEDVDVGEDWNDMKAELHENAENALVVPGIWSPWYRVGTPASRQAFFLICRELDSDCRADERFLHPLPAPFS